MKLTAVVAASQNGVIGREGGLPWHLPAELARFKQITMGKPIIMGRKTHESIGRPLPGRQNIVITRDKSYQAEGCQVVGSLDEAIKAAGDADEAFVIGGASIYQLAMPRTDKIFLTRVDADLEGDKRFDFDNSGWKLINSQHHDADAENEFAFDVQEWIRK